MGPCLPTVWLPPGVLDKDKDRERVLEEDVSCFPCFYARGCLGWFTAAAENAVLCWFVRHFEWLVAGTHTTKHSIEQTATAVSIIIHQSPPSKTSPLPLLTSMLHSHHPTQHHTHHPNTVTTMADVGDIEAYLEAQVEQQVSFCVWFLGVEGEGG